MYFFSKQIALSPHQGVIFLVIPSTVILQLRHGEEGGTSQNQPGFAGRAGGSDTAQRNRSCSNVPNQGYSDSPLELEVAKNMLCPSTDCKIIPCKPDLWVNEILIPFKTDSKNTAYFFFFVCVYCSFSSWWSDKFLELSRNLLTSNIFNNLFVHFQVCLAIALFPFSCFNIHLPFQMSLLYCDDFQWLKFPYFLFLLEINYHLLKWQCLHGFCVFLLDPLFLCMHEIFSLDSPNLSKDPFFQDHFEIDRKSVV